MAMIQILIIQLLVILTCAAIERPPSCVNMETNKDFGRRASFSSQETSDCYQHPNNSSSNLDSVEENNDNSDEPSAEKQDVIRALVKALMLVEQMEG